MTDERTVNSARTSTPSGPAAPAGQEIDPVCGMRVDPSQAAASAEYAGRRFFFCSHGCCDRFEAEPARYAKTGDGTTQVQGLAPKSETPPAAPKEKVEWTCPM